MRSIHKREALRISGLRCDLGDVEGEKVVAAGGKAESIFCFVVVSSHSNQRHGEPEPSSTHVKDLEQLINECKGHITLEILSANVVDGGMEMIAAVGARHSYLLVSGPCHAEYGKIRVRVLFFQVFKARKPCPKQCAIAKRDESCELR